MISAGAHWYCNVAVEAMRASRPTVHFDDHVLSVTVSLAREVFHSMHYSYMGALYSNDKQQFKCP